MPANVHRQISFLPEAHGAEGAGVRLLPGALLECQSFPVILLHVVEQVSLVMKASRAKLARERPLVRAPEQNRAQPLAQGEGVVGVPLVRVRQDVRRQMTPGPILCGALRAGVRFLSVGKEMDVEPFEARKGTAAERALVRTFPRATMTDPFLCEWLLGQGVHIVRDLSTEFSLFLDYANRK